MSGVNEQAGLHAGAHVEKGCGEGLPCTLVIQVLVLGEGGEAQPAQCCDKGSEGALGVVVGGGS